MNAATLTTRLAELQSWRYGWEDQIGHVERMLDAEGFASPEATASFAALKKKINAERVTIAFVAEMGRGKSELINVLFFPNIRKPLMPSGAGHATRCVTELRFDREAPSAIRLLPIETREDTLSYHQLLADASRWHCVPFDVSQPDSVIEALACLSQTKQVALRDAVSWGLHGDALAAPVASREHVAQVEIPRWRHAIINFPHPILDAGLVIIDTPGFAALSSEPELAHHRLPLADALLLVLDINTGATKDDLAIWKDLLGGNRNLRERVTEEITPAKLVILNKLDLLLNPQDQNREAEIKRHVSDTAALLRINTQCIVAVSARLAAEAKRSANAEQITQSNIGELEAALIAQLPQNRQAKLSIEAGDNLSNIIASVHAALSQKRYTLLEKLQQLNVLRYKNEKLIETLTEQAGLRLDKIEVAMKEMRGLKGIHARLIEELAERVNPELAVKLASQTRYAIAAGMMPGATQAAVEQYFTASRRQIESAEKKIDEIKSIFSDVAARLQAELGIKDAASIPFPTQRFHSEWQKAKMAADNELLRPSNTLSKMGGTLGEQFEKIVSSKIIHIFKIANRETTVWARALYGALEQPIDAAREHHNARIENIEKMKTAELDLTERISEMQAQIDVVKRKFEKINDAQGNLDRFLGKMPEGAGV